MFTKKIGNQQKVSDASINTDPGTSASAIDVKQSLQSAGKNLLFL
jgi:hypothetical protein